MAEWGEASLFCTPDVKASPPVEQAVTFNTFSTTFGGENVEKPSFRVVRGVVFTCLQRNWPNRNFKTQRIRGYWTNSCCPLNFAFHFNSVDREIACERRGFPELDLPCN